MVKLNAMPLLPTAAAGCHSNKSNYSACENVRERRLKSHRGRDEDGGERNKNKIPIVSHLSVSGQ